MCVIYGFVTKAVPDVRILHAMGDTLRHRGPDDEGEILSHKNNVGVALGHKRLSIIDLSPAGRQPMSTEDESVWITYNGEIYNFREIRRELEQKGHRFKSNSDTEVILRLYEALGIECLQKARWHVCLGALGQQEEHTVSGARDRSEVIKQT